jgi:hypothetical protein
LSIALLKRTRDGAKNGHVDAAMNRRIWCVRDNGFHTNVTRLVRGGIEGLREVLASCLGCYEVGLLTWWKCIIKLSTAEFDQTNPLMSRSIENITKVWIRNGRRKDARLRCFRFNDAKSATEEP